MRRMEGMTLFLYLFLPVFQDCRELSFMVPVVTDLTGYKLIYSRAHVIALGEGRLGGGGGQRMNILPASA